jgi:hypothetical protein
MLGMKLGRKDSNLRMRGPKPRDLPLVDAPVETSTISRVKIIFGRRQRKLSAGICEKGVHPVAAQRANRLAKQTL